MPNITIKYFNMRGRAEPIRLALTIGGVPFTDERLTSEQFGALKKNTKELPFGQLPVMVVDGATISQSGAIIRYCGKLAGLYPKDNMLEAARVDEMLGAITDLTNAVFKYRGNDEALKKKAREEFVNVDLPRFAEGLTRIYGKNDKKHYICGNELTIADLALYYTVWNIKAGFVDYVARDVFDMHPKILRSYKAVSEHPKVVEWNNSHM